MNGKGKEMSYRNAIRRWKSSEDTGNSVGGNMNTKGGIYCKSCGSKQPYSKTPLYKTNREGIPLSQFQCNTCENTWVAKDFKREGNTIGDIILQQFANRDAVKGMDLETFDNLTAIGIEPLSERQFLREHGIERHPKFRGVALTWHHPRFDGTTNHKTVCRDCGHECVTFYKVDEYKCPECSWAQRGKVPTGNKYLYVA